LAGVTRTIIRAGIRLIITDFTTRGIIARTITDIMIRGIIAHTITVTIPITAIRRTGQELPAL